MSDTSVLANNIDQHHPLECRIYVEAHKPFAIFNDCGSLVLFDLDGCKKAAAITDNNQVSFIAKLCLALLDKAAESVDFVQREERLGGGTYGDAIRNFNFMQDVQNG